MERYFESIRAYLKTSSLSDMDCYYLLIWASKIKKFKKGIPREKQEYFKKNYLPFMKELRLLGIPLLKRQLKMI